MVEGPAVTLDDDHAPAVRIDALEMFVDLLARVEEDGSSDAFYGRLCEARDVSHFIAYLLSEPVKLFTGSVLVMDGGISSQGW